MSKEDYNLQITAERIDTLIKEFEASSDRVVREKAEELVRILMELQGAALGKILQYVRDSGETAEKLLDRLTHDELIEGLLVVHGLHPQDVETRVTRALDRLSPSLKAHGGGVKYLDFTEGTLSLQLEGTCHGCPSSSATLNSSIQKAVEEAAPEVLRIEVKEANTAASDRPNENGRTPMSNHSAAERCGFCSEALTSDHSHVVDLETRRLLCSCRACYLLFIGRGASGGKYRSVPDRYVHARDLRITEAQWDKLQVPVRLAFFFFNSTLGRTVAFYPSPAGAMESLLSLDAWREITSAHSLLQELSPDVEALLVRKNPAAFAGFDSYVVPIDACYELIGRIRRRWKGFDGGEEARSEIESFFTRLRAKSEPPKLQVSSR
jgi:Fe-S cluster biogenesis protein NfuA